MKLTGRQPAAEILKDDQKEARKEDEFPSFSCAETSKLCIC